MKSRVMAFRAALILLVVVLQGCATTITRVEQHQALFDSLDDATQASLLQGETQIGYNMEMTYIALGSPDEIRRKQTETGDTVTWVYQYSSATYHYSAGSHFQSRFHGGGYGHHPYDPFLYTYQPYNYVVHDYLRIEFSSRHVVGIEEIHN